MAGALLTIIRRLRETRRIAKMSRAELEELKLAKFRRLVRYVANKSPYYARIIRERAIDVEHCVPTDFPVLTKPMLMDNFDDIVTDRRITKAVIGKFLEQSKDPNDLLFNEYRVLHTSGSSGQVGYFLYSKSEWLTGMTQGMGRRRRNQRLRRRNRGRFKMAYYAAVGGHFAGVSMVSSAMRGLARLFVKVELLEINSPLPAVIDRLNTFQPDVLGGYTTGLKILAEQQIAGKLRIAPIGIGTGGEAMTQADKAFLETAFKCQASNGYGSTEHLSMGGANPDGETMTLYDCDVIYEIFDDHSLVTNLFNATLPLIRYRMSDILRPIEPQPETPPYLVINSLVGRTEKVPTFINSDGIEDFISPHTINEFLVAGLTRFQMRLVSKTAFQFAVIFDPTLSSQQQAEARIATEHRLRELLDQKLMNNVTFEVVPVAELPPDPRTGKFRLIVDAPPESAAA